MSGRASRHDTGASLACERLLLLVTGTAPRSQRARSHLRRVLEAHGLDGAPIEEVDVLRQPRVALEYHVFATPALICVRGDGPADVMYGDLSDEEALATFLAAIT
jgi:circadian clock protein KaiB